MSIIADSPILSSLDSGEDAVTLPRPLEDVDLPGEPARRRLQEKLIEQFGFDPDSALALSRAAVDPAAFRRSLDAPLRQPVPGGWLTYVIADLLTPGVSVNPVNPRETERRVFPAAAKPGQTVMRPLTLSDDPERHPRVQLNGDSPQHVVDVIEQSANWLRENNPTLGEEIATDRVLEPVVVAMAQIRHRDGSEPIHIPIAVDGSTRTAHCHALVDVSSPDVAYRWSRAPYRDWKGMLASRVAVQDRAEEDVTTVEAAAHRALVYQGKVLLRVELVRGGAPVSMVGAIRALVAGIHVSPPKSWPQGSQIDEVADAVLDRLVQDNRITSSLRDYLAGMVEPSLLQGTERHHPDTRAAYVAAVIFDAANARSISVAYRFLRDKRRLGRQDKPDLVAELMLRSFRTDHRATTLKALRSALQRTVNLPELRSASWSPKDRSLDDLLAASLAELARDGERLGSDRLELFVRAAYWMVNHRVLARDTRETQDELGDQRNPSMVLRAMLLSEHGIRQLHRAIADGRAHPVPVSGSDAAPIREVDPEGTPLVRSGGGHKPLTDFRVREMFPPADRPRRDGDRQGGGPVTPSIEAPRIRLTRLLRNARLAAENLHQLVSDMEGVTENGVPVVRIEGVPPGSAREITTRLQEAMRKLDVWAYTGQSAVSDTPILGDDDLFDHLADEEAP